MGERDVLSAIRDDLRRRPEEERKFPRYFSLVPLAADRSRNPVEQRRLVRAALAKLLNSLSWKKAIAPVTAVGPDDLVVVVDLRSLGWDKEDPFGEMTVWESVLKQYPHALTYDEKDFELGPLYKEIQDLGGQKVTHVWADWFIATAPRPPLYGQLLELPKTQRELEDKLDVNFKAAFENNKLVRAGVSRSGVSPHNRVFDRMATKHGAYWLSYDMESENEKHDVSRYPLGPPLFEHPFPQQAFQADGSTVLFNLPNGLQAYAAFNSRGGSVPAVPSSLLSDPGKTAGSPTVVPALSCISCHKLGPVRFADDLRERAQVPSEARKKLERLVPQQEVLDNLFEQDENRFLQALQTAAGGFLLSEQDGGNGLRDLPEPIAAVARMYQDDVTLEQASLELGLQDPALLAELIRSRSKPFTDDLVPLVNGRRVPRQTWDNIATPHGFSPFQDCARELGRGVPYRVRQVRKPRTDSLSLRRNRKRFTCPFATFAARPSSLRSWEQSSCCWRVRRSQARRRKGHSHSWRRWPRILLPS